MVIPILIRRHTYIESGPSFSLLLSCTVRYVTIPIPSSWIPLYHAGLIALLVPSAKTRGFLCHKKIAWDLILVTIRPADALTPDGINTHRQHWLKNEIFINGCTESCQNYNFLCSQWRKFYQNDISVLMRALFNKHFNKIISMFQWSLEIECVFEGHSPFEKKWTTRYIATLRNVNSL